MTWNELTGELFGRRSPTGPRLRASAASREAENVTRERSSLEETQSQMEVGRWALGAEDPPSRVATGKGKGRERA